MASGEQKWSSRGQQVKRFTSDPIPKGKYPFELLKDNMEVKLSKENPENSIPRIGVRFAAQGTAKDENSKDRLYFHDFYLSLKPGKDNVLMVNRGGQLTEFARAQGDELDDIDLLEKEIIDPDGNGEDTITVKYLSPEQVMEYLESKVGTVTEGKLTIEPDTAQADDPGKGIKKGDKLPLGPEHPGRNKMQQWEVDEAALAGSQEEEAAPPPKATGTTGKSTAATGGKVTQLKKKK